MIDLRALTPSQGVLFLGAQNYDTTGARPNGVGDVNGDGFPDIVIGAPALGEYDVGSAYLLFGSSAFPSVIELSGCTTTFASHCTLIIGTEYYGEFGLTPSPAGDINGDGFADFMVGAPLNDNYYYTYRAGQMFVLYGRKTFPPVIDLFYTPDFGGFIIQGADAGDALAVDATLAGDMNRDGFSDILVTLYNAFASPDTNGTALYLIYGGNNLPKLLNVTSYPSLVSFQGEVGSTNTFPTVSGNYDINQDGTNDILLGLPQTTLNGTQASGTVLVIYGKQQFASRAIDTSKLSAPSEVARYERVTNVQPDNNGAAVSFVGDVNGDGAVDFIFGGYEADNHNGRAYLIYGIPNPSSSPSHSPSTSVSMSVSVQPSQSRAKTNRPTRTQSKPKRHSRKPSATLSPPQKSAGYSTGSVLYLMIFSFVINTIRLTM
eukprot:TRINITY_DN8240_c0_g1_i1.p1 TRINITY_DN8240_c0_g1~~TRINITY_DN8240_c0_g1_i1.p1  ORF type:complete len:432 (-),score=73.87 TRINITY_DN8240_c0_g1_i1:71-1366(-)